MTDWLDTARLTPFPQVAAQLGMAQKAKRWGPCPACGATSTRNDRRPPIGRVNCRGWVCNACKAGGDVIDLVSFSVNGVRASKAGRAFRGIRVFFEGGEAPPIETAETEGPPRLTPDELTPLFRSMTPAAQSQHFGVRSFMAERGYKSPPAWVLPNRFRAPWWPWGDFPLVVPAFTGSGALSGLHGRAVSAAAPRKVTWPKDVDSRGLLFADPKLGLPMLRGIRRPTRALIVEGITDYLWAAENQAGRSAVFGIASGSASALRLVDFRGVEIFIGTDDDKAGRRYASLVAEAVAPAPCRILPLGLARRGSAT